jgi:hypothetical protein
MYVLYLDESGNPDDPSDTHFILAGAAVYEKSTYYLSQAIDAVQTKHFPGVQPIAFHATEIRAGKDFWRKVDHGKRLAVLDDLCLATANQGGVTLFASVIEKTSTLHGENAVKAATEEVCIAFDRFLVRKHKAGDSQRGLLVFAEGQYHKRGRVWVKDFRELGTRVGALNNLSDIPYFATPKESRLLQVADVVSHSVFRLYERKDPSMISHFIHKFDLASGIKYGMVHVTDKRDTCECPRCFSQRTPHNFGPWLTVPVAPAATTAVVVAVAVGVAEVTEVKVDSDESKG